MVLRTVYKFNAHIQYIFDKYYDDSITPGRLSMNVGTAVNR